jgi:prepilin signal peptidase PulO-like enzyme (type II secretory pathway)
LFAYRLLTCLSAMPIVNMTLKKWKFYPSFVGSLWNGVGCISCKSVT